MPTDVSWYIPDKVILIKLVGDITVADLEALIVKAEALTSTSPSKSIITMVDATEVESFTRNIMQIGQAVLTHGSYEGRRKTRSVVFFGMRNRLFQIMSLGIGRIVSIEFRHFPDLAAAQVFLDTVDFSEEPPTP